MPKFGKRQNSQRYQCTQCRKMFTDARDNTLDGMYMPIEKAEKVLWLLLEGNMFRASNVSPASITERS